jgi:hypothetical protein
MSKSCPVPGCTVRSRFIRGMCVRHYKHRWESEHPRIRPPRKRIPRSEWKRGAVTIAEDFWSNVAVTADPNRCWFFLRRIGKNGYGGLRYRGQLVEAHRYSFFLTHGRWPEPMCLHSCDNPKCVNPNHLSEGTQEQNMREASDRGKFANRSRSSSPGVGDRITA